MHAERALRDAGYTVWRDAELPAHLTYAEVIEERLKTAKAVLVLWSAEAVKSQWVRAEADAAREFGTLVQSSVDGTVPPIPFNQIQCADLKGWSGESDHPGWRKLHASIVALAGQPEQTANARKARRSAQSICVLPFQNMSGETVPDYFGDGISEDIISDLLKVPSLAVTPRKTAFAFKGQDIDAGTVADELGVGYVLEGTIRRAGDRVRITADLVDGLSGEHIWFDRYYREFTDIFSVQDEISTAIAEAVRTRLVPTESKPAEARGRAAKAEPLSAAEEEKPPVLPAPAPGEPSAFHFQSGSAEAPDEQFLEEASVVPEDGDDEHYSSSDSYSEQYWYPDEDEEDESASRWRRRREMIPEVAPRLIALGLVLLLVAGFVGATFWRSPAPAPQEQDLIYTVTETVNVRSLPTQKGSRILGELEPGDTISIVPALAGAQPDWLKIKEGPYVGGYVWRESTRPMVEAGAPDDSRASASDTGKANS